MAAEHSGEGFAAAFKGHVTQVFRVDPGQAGDQRGLHPVLAADGGASAEDDAGRVFLQGLDQIVQALIRRVGTYGDRAVIGAHCCQPAHPGFVVPAELALRQVEQGSAGERGDGARIIGTLGDHRVVSHCADTAGHVSNAHWCFQQAAVFQAALRQFAGQVETAAGLGRGDAFRAFRFGGQQLAGKGHAGGGQGDAGKGSFHGVFL